MDRNSAYYKLLERYRPMVWRLCWRHARGDWDRCNDLVQEVSIALWEHFGQLRPNATPQEQRAWVRWQARSVLDLQRRKQHLVTVPFTDAMTETLVDEPESDKEKVAEVMELLTPEEQRLVRLQLCGYNVAEVAQIMHLTRDAVYQRMHRIIAKARNALLVVALLLLTTTLAVAVVPQWRQAVFGDKPAVVDSLPDTPLPSPRGDDTVAATWVEVDWDYHGLFPWGDSVWSGGWAWQHDREAGTVTYYRSSGGRVIRAVIHNPPAAYFDSLISNNDTMNTALKQAASAAVMVALATATQAQVAHDFQTVTQQGDTLFCTITDSAQHHVSVRGDESVWNAPYIHYSDTLVIPATVEHGGEQYTVTTLADSAFYSHGEITAAVIPSSVTTIGRLALASTGIFELEVPDGVDSIGLKAFGLIGNVIYHGNAGGSPWSALTVNGIEEDGLVYPDSNRTAVTACRPWVTQAVLPASVRDIGRYAFSASQLESITLPEGLETIGNSAFQSCSRLGSVVIPSTVTEIGRYAFYNSFRSSGEAKVTIADAECSIGWGAFYFCKMSAIDLGSRVTSIDQDAFASLARTDSIIVPNSCTYLAARAFCYNYNGRLKKVHLPEGLDTLRDELLHGCTGLRELVIPPTVVYIGEMALAELSHVTELTLPAGLTWLGPWALGDCSSISNMTSLAAVPPQACDNTFDGMSTSLTLTVPCHSAAAYDADPNWSRFTNIVEDCSAVPEVEDGRPTVHAADGAVTVEGADGEIVRVYDAGGRLVASATCHATCRLPLPAAGLYLVQIGDRPAHKITVAD